MVACWGCRPVRRGRGGAGRAGVERRNGPKWEVRSAIKTAVLPASLSCLRPPNRRA